MCGAVVVGGISGGRVEWNWETRFGGLFIRFDISTGQNYYCTYAINKISDTPKAQRL